MIKIGIIDTEIRTDQIIFDKTHFCNADYKTSVLHGTEVANVLLSLNPYLDITAIPILDSNIKGNAIDLITAIEKCIDQKVDFINLSLGYASNNESIISMLHEICLEAKRNNILIVAAKANEKNKMAYPAEFSEIISVDNDIRQKAYCSVNKNEVIFNFNVLYLWEKEIKIREGNSYLVPYLIGILANLYKEGGDKQELISNLKGILKEENMKKIVVESISNRFAVTINKQVLYVVCGLMSENDYNIINYLKPIAKSVEICTDDNVQTVLSKEKIIFWGLGDYVESITNINKVRQVIKQCYLCGNDIITVLPYFNIWERYQITKDHSNRLVSIYN